MVNGAPQQQQQEQIPAQQPAQAAPAVPAAALEEQPIPTQPTDVDIRAQIEEGLAQLPDESKELLASFSVVPEFGDLMGTMFGPELGSFFAELSDPELTLVVVPKAELDEIMDGADSSQQLIATADEEPTEVTEEQEQAIETEEAGATAFGKSLA